MTSKVVGSVESSLLHLSGLQLPSMKEPLPRISLSAGQSAALILPGRALVALEACLLGETSAALLGGEVLLAGWDPSVIDLPVTDGISQCVARTFSPLFGRGCWVENLGIEENILLPAMMRGESESHARERALGMARAFGVPSLPVGRRSEVKDPKTLAVCQWVRALTHLSARLFLMVDPLHSDITSDEVEVLALHCRLRSERDQCAFFWLLPEDAFKHCAALGVDSVFDYVDRLLATPAP